MQKMRMKIEELSLDKNNNSRPASTTNPKGVEEDEDIIGTNSNENDDGDDIEEWEELDRQEDHVDRVGRQQVEDN